MSGLVFASPAPYPGSYEAGKFSNPARERESFPLDTLVKDTHNKSTNNLVEMESRLKPGMLVVVSVDPVATLRPLFEEDDAIEKVAWEMHPRMKKYVGFLRGVEPIRIQADNEGDDLEGQPIQTTVSALATHLNLVHTQRPTRSRYDTIDESMCVPLCVERPSSPTSPASSSRSPQRQNSRRRTPTRKPLSIQAISGALPWKELYAHTIMDAFAAVSEVECTDAQIPSGSISTKDMQRYDGYQAIDRARESNQHSKTQAFGDDPVDCIDDWEVDMDEEDEGEDESQFRLSTVISGLTIDEDVSIVEPTRDLPISHAPSLRMPSPRVASPVSSGIAPSAWKGKSIRLHQPQRSPTDYITAKPTGTPPLQEPLSPKSPTMTGTSGETTDTKNTTFSAASTPTSTSLATTIPDHVIPPSPIHCEGDAEEACDPEAMPWNFTQLELGGGLGVNKPLKRQCAIRVRIWLDLGKEEVKEPEDPRTFFEELKMLRALERTSDMRYVAQQKQANAQRVLEWRLSTTAKPVKSPSKSTLSLNNPFSSSHNKHVSSSGCHNPFKIARRRTSMELTPTAHKSRKPSFLMTNTLHAPAFLLDRRRSSGALQGAKVLAAEHTTNTVSSFRKIWNRLVCREPR